MILILAAFAAFCQDRIEIGSADFAVSDIFCGG
jgi:hypothetical protein